MIQPTTISKTMTYDLTGGDLKAHVDHKVEVTGSTGGKMMDKGKMGMSDMHGSSGQVRQDDFHDLLVDCRGMGRALARAARADSHPSTASPRANVRAVLPPARPLSR
jgi:hypothetical protein